MSLSQLENFFKPETRSSGSAFVSKGKVSLARPADIQIEAYIRASSSFKVTLKSDFDDKEITIDCSCPASKKGQYCKHMWAAILMTEEKYPDFLEAKTELQKASMTSSAIAGQQKPAGSSSQTAFRAQQAESQAAYKAKHAESQAAMKAKQSDYRKEQYQKQKQRVKDLKQAKRQIFETPEFPEDVEEALKYFEGNGFPLREGMTKQSVSFAMKKLARIFHPDMGGSHEEILELNQFAKVLDRYCQN